MRKIGIGSTLSGPALRKAPCSVRTAMLLAAALTIAVFSGCGEEPEGEPTVVIVTPANGSTVVGPNVLVKVKTTDFKFAGSAAAKTSASHHGDEDVAGHVHIFLDKPVGLDYEAIKTMTKDTATIPITTPGTHYLIVQGADAKHVNFASMVDSVMFTVTIP